MSSSRCRPRNSRRSAARVDDGAREEVRARLLALLEDGDRDVAEPLGDLGRSSSSWPRRIAHARPAGPAPTIRTPTSMRSSAGSVGAAIASPARTAAGSRRAGRHQPPFRCAHELGQLGDDLVQVADDAEVANSKIGAFGSLLIATITLELCIPTLCWIAPEMPQAT